MYNTGEAQKEDHHIPLGGSEGHGREGLSSSSGHYLVRREIYNSLATGLKTELSPRMINQVRKEFGSLLLSLSP